MSAKGWIIGSSAAVVAVGAGAATWAAVSFFSAGPQAAEALPADTIAYATLDLSPSGKQKIAALKVANKFPALRKELGLDTTDDVRRKVVEEIAKETGCSVDYAKDVAPWIGSTVAVAAVNVADPKPVIVLEVKDEKKANAQAESLVNCGGESTAFAIHGDWMVLAETESTVQEVVAAAEKKSLADDSDFKKWTSEVGDQGIATAYVGPNVAAAFTAVAGDLTQGLPGAGVAEGFLPGCPKKTDDAEMLKTASASFKGAAATLRFGGDGVELVAVGDLGSAPGSSTGDAGLRDLPNNVGFAAGASFGKNWTSQIVDQLVEACGDKKVVDDLIAQANETTGLDLISDIATLTSGSVQFALGSDFSVDNLFSDGAQGVPVALRFKGDAAKMKDVLARVSTAVEKNIGTEFVDMMGMGELLTPSVGKDSVAIGLSKEFNDDVTKGGNLGDDASFKAAVPDADKASGALFLGLDGLKSLFESGAESEHEKKEIEENTAPVDSLGLSMWMDGSITHGRLLLALK